MKLNIKIEMFGEKNESASLSSSYWSEVCLE